MNEKSTLRRMHDAVWRVWLVIGMMMIGFAASMMFVRGTQDHTPPDLIEKVAFFGSFIFIGTVALEFGVFIAGKIFDGLWRLLLGNRK